MGTELYMTPALAELWLRYSSPAEMQEWTDHYLPSEYMASTADVVARLHTTADDCRTDGINVDDAIVTLSDFGRSNTFVSQAIRRSHPERAGNCVPLASPINAMLRHP